MKIKVFSSAMALLFLSLVTSHLATAQTAGPAASGAYQLSFDDGYTKYADFDATTQFDGSTTGSMTFTDEGELAFQDLDGTGDPSLNETYRGYYVKADFDDLTVENNKAVMSGTVTDSSVRAYIGRRVLLTVADNGDNTETSDQLTWGIYKPVVRNWTPSDLEREDDRGASLTWVAKDAEREDDRGIAMPRSEAVNSKSYPVSAYEFVEAARTAGDIKVQP
jgi:hypothetical protein